MLEVKKIVNSIFRNVTEKGYFDIKKGNEPIPAVMNKPMSIVPGEMTEYVDDCGYGCCFVFAAYMINEMEKNNINCFMITTREGNGMRASVLYEDEGKLFVANPVEDIEYFTEKEVKPEDRKKYYIDDTASMIIDGELHDDSCYTLEEFSKKYGQVWVLGKMNSSANETLSEAMKTQNSRCIMPPKEANYDCKKLVR